MSTKQTPIGAILIDIDGKNKGPFIELDLRGFGFSFLDAGDTAQITFEGGGAPSVIDTADLALVDDTQLDDNAFRWVDSRGMLVRLSKTSTLPLSSGVFATKSGTGRWLRVAIPNGAWSAQMIWDVDPIGGNDDSPTGQSPSPLKTIGEWSWRFMQMNPGGATTVAALSNGAVLPQATINVATTAGLPTSGSFFVNSSAGRQLITYTGLTATSFTGCSGGTGTLSTGGAVSTEPVVNLLGDIPNTDALRGPVMFSPIPSAGAQSFYNVFFRGTSTVLASGASAAGTGVSATTTVAVASNGAVLPQATINVTSTTGFATQGIVYIRSTSGIQAISYTGVTGTTFTGCTGGAGTLSSTAPDNAVFSQATITSAATSFAGQAGNLVQFSTGVYCWILKDLGSNSARVTAFYNTNNDATATTDAIAAAPANGTAFDIVSLTQFAARTIAAGQPLQLQPVFENVNINGTFWEGNEAIILRKGKISNFAANTGTSWNPDLRMRCFGCLFTSGSVNTRVASFQANRSTFRASGSINIVFQSLDGAHLAFDTFCIQSGELQVGRDSGTELLSCGSATVNAGLSGTGTATGLGIFDAVATAPGLGWGVTVARNGTLTVGAALYGFGNVNGTQSKENGRVQVVSTITPALGATTTELQLAGAATAIPALVAGAAVPAAAALTTWPEWVTNFSRHVLDYTRGANIIDYTNP